MVRRFTDFPTSLLFLHSPEGCEGWEGHVGDLPFISEEPYERYIRKSSARTTFGAPNCDWLEALGLKGTEVLTESRGCSWKQLSETESPYRLNAITPSCSAVRAQ